MIKTRVAAGFAAATLVAGLGASAARSNVARIPDGIYRANVSEAFLRAAGVAGLEAAHNAGIQTLIFKGMRWTNRTMNRFHPPDCSGDLSYLGNRVTLILAAAPGCATGRHRLFSARWSYKQGELRFTEIQPRDRLAPPAWGGKPWKKIG